MATNYSPEAKRQRSLEDAQAIVVDALITCDAAISHARFSRSPHTELLRELYHLRQCQRQLRDWLAANMEAFATEEETPSHA
jgi:hypothetical protein